ncbi:MBL fold metallo-hydrolase [Cohnella fermenti]|nr:MBL fold metallo-hydrolase [Cohnella fermenti]
MKLTEHVFAVGGGALGPLVSDALDCNVYALRAGDDYVLIDAGAGLGTEAIVANLLADGIEPERIRLLILTHAHADHSGGAFGLRSRLQTPSVAASAMTADIVGNGDEERMGLIEARAAGVYPSDYRFAACPVERVLSPGETLRLGRGLTLEVLPAPGHSADMIALYCPQLRALFAADAVFPGGKLAVQTTRDYSEKAYRETIARLAELEVEQLYAGHGPPLTAAGGASIAAANARFAAGLPPLSIV